ncbi:MAG TPA: hypothetical protein VNT55_14320 [Baekduia sp.]|nr:hypothetical protein [Baekduia sp.]
MTDFIDGLEHDLVEAARRRARASANAARRTTKPKRARPPLRSLLLAAALLVLLAGSAAGATLLALRGSVIPAPQAVPPEQTPAAGTSRVASIRAADPQRGLLPWTIRVARSETGLLCSTVGQVDRDGTFGLVGLDGRFRAIADGVSDSCGTARPGGGISLIGARIFDAKARANVRTVVSGVGSARAIERVDVTTVAGTRRVPVVDGAFAVALRGYPEDLGIRATITLAGGRRETHDFGRSAFVTPDPLGGPAWKVMSFAVGNDARSCASFLAARATQATPRSPSACGDLGEGRQRTGWYVAVRRIAGRVRGTGPFAGDWHHAPPRTAVWGGVGEEVRSITLQVPGAAPRPLPIAPNRVFLAVLPPAVDPATVTTRFTLKNGRVETARGSARLATHPIASTP